MYVDVWECVCVCVLKSQEDRQPVVSVSSVHVEENSGVVITNSSFHVLDHDTPDNEIVITITKKPSYGTTTHTYMDPLSSNTKCISIYIANQY